MGLNGKPLHPPAMGGKTAWGVQNVISCATDAPEHLMRMQRAQKSFQEREENRLRKLAEMDGAASSVLEDRKARRAGFEMGMIKGVEENKKRQDEIFKKMQEEREKKRLAKLERKKQGTSKTKDSKKKRKRESSSSSSSSGDDSSSSSSSESSAKKTKKSKKEKRE